MTRSVARDERHPKDRSRGTTAATVLAVFLPACGSGGSAVSAAVTTAVAIGAAGYERSQGRCYSNCVPGTRCNEATGYCDRVPCEGRCRPGEVCRETVMGERCEPWGEVQVPPVGDAP